MNAFEPRELTAIIHNEPEGGYWAEVPELPGCMTQGETLDEVFANIDEAVESWLIAGVDLPAWAVAEQDALRHEINIGLEQLERGESAPWDVEQIKAEGRRLLAERRQQSDAVSSPGIP